MGNLRGTSVSRINYFKELPTVTAVGINGLEETKRNPNVDREDVQVTCVPAVQNRSGNGTSAKDENLGRVCVFSGKTKRCRILVVKLMNVLVKNAGVKRLVGYDAIVSNQGKRYLTKTYRSNGTYPQTRRK
jgi:hypothetical protein